MKVAVGQYLTSASFDLAFSVTRPECNIGRYEPFTQCAGTIHITHLAPSDIIWQRGKIWLLFSRDYSKAKKQEPLPLIQVIHYVLGLHNVRVIISTKVDHAPPRGETKEWARIDSVDRCEELGHRKECVPSVIRESGIQVVFSFAVTGK